MRLLFHPALWCLFLAFFLAPSCIQAKSKPIVLKTKNADYEYFKHISNSKEAIFTNATTANNLSTNATIINSPNLVGLNYVTHYGNASFEENSYNYSKGSAAAETEFSENYQTLQYVASTDTKTSFLQGLYYGFACMVLLINLVCYFIFEEKLFFFYSVTLVGITLVFFFNDGLHNLFGIPAPSNPFLVQSLLLWFAMGSSALFAANYLSLKEFFPKLKLLSDL